METRAISDGVKNFPDIEFPDTPFQLDSSLVLLGRRGSEAHGTYVPPEDPLGIDDRDLMGICIPPRPYVLGLRQWEGAESIKGVWDVVLYDFRKFVRLLCKQNPNVLSLLWLEPEDYLFRGPAGQKLIDNRDLFRSRAAYTSFVGYAYGQMKKMTGGAHEGYMGAKRKTLVEKFGYDCKNASHLVRLLHMGMEYLRTGKLQVRRTVDVPLMVEIKKGGWTLEHVQEYAGGLFDEMKRAEAECVLPDEIDLEAVERLVVECMQHHLDEERTRSH